LYRNHTDDYAKVWSAPVPPDPNLLKKTLNPKPSPDEKQSSTVINPNFINGFIHSQGTRFDGCFQEMLES
jgi:hypothetical protein